jgi:hypothetical protein
MRLKFPQQLTHPIPALGAGEGRLAIGYERVFVSYFGQRYRQLPLGFFSRPASVALIHSLSLDSTHAQLWTALPQGPKIHWTLLTYPNNRIKISFQIDRVRRIQACLRL